VNCKTSLSAAILAACVVAGADRARAEVFVFSFSAKDGSGHGEIVADQLSNGTYGAASIQGVANGSPIVALASLPGQVTHAADPKRPLEFFSVAFTTEDGSIYYLTSRGGAYLLSVYVGKTGDFLSDEPAQLSLSVPENPTWAMMLAACAGAGFMQRRRRLKARVACAPRP
jgi:hypothetical protein